MPDIHFQFYATPDELTEWVQDWANTNNNYLVAMRFPPVSFEAIDVNEIPALATDEHTSRISFLTRPFDPSIKYQSDFDNKYSNQLFVRFGRLTPYGLEESCISSRTEDVEALKHWKEIAKHLRANTKTGITSINRQKNTVGFHRSLRYSMGAKALESNGVEILPFGNRGPNRPQLRLGDVRARLSDMPLPRTASD